MNFRHLFLISLALVVSGLGWAQTGVLKVDLGGMRTAENAMQFADQAVRVRAKKINELTSGYRDQLARYGKFSTAQTYSNPYVVKLENSGLRTSSSNLRNYGPRLNTLTISFDNSGPFSFTNEYKQLLTDTFTQVQATLNIFFGPPALSGTVIVRNYDATIDDRDAVAGGYFVADNGSGQAEIRFPVYGSPEAAAVNFVHCLCLAYMGGSSYDYDAFQEGLARAAVMRIVRTTGAMPVTLDAGKIEEVLDNTYDVGTFYDWYNQRPLAASKFIADNLIGTPLPVSGSLGGIYLLRYQMAGSAWQKLLAEYPTFIAAYNQAFYGNTTISGNIPQLVALGQSVIDTLNGSPNATIEGLSFANWFLRQYILQTNDTTGQKLFLHPLPLLADGGTSDFGVFLIQATFFETLSNGHETLGSAVSYPIFWTDVYDRLFPSAQDERMDIAGAYGSLAPNFANLYAGQPYRAAIDVPVQDKMARVYVPSGAISTGANPTEKDFYGTVLGVEGGVGVTLRVRLTVGIATVIDNIPVTNGAFGTNIGTTQFLGPTKLRVEVIRTVSGVDTVVIDRKINKGFGPLAVDLRINNGELLFSPPTNLPAGLSTTGFPVEPFANTAGAVLGLSESNVLLARWNGSKAKYDIYPDSGTFQLGNGYFLRLAAPNNSFTVLGKYHPGTSVSVSLRPGWNLITCPIDEIVPTSRVRVIVAADSPQLYADAVGQSIGTDFFTFNPGPNDAASGVPETGTMVAATQFEPGKAYFVRVTAAEGATLLFAPETAALRPSPLAATSESSLWRMKARLSDWHRHATAIIGQSRSATQAFDPAEDSPLPPSIASGLQIGVEGNMYRDTRNPVSTYYRLELRGLIKGKRYWLDLTPELGNLRAYWVSIDGSAFKLYTRATQLIFNADKAVKNVRIYINSRYTQ